MLTGKFPTWYEVAQHLDPFDRLQTWLFWTKLVHTKGIKAGFNTPLKVFPFLAGIRLPSLYMSVKGTTGKHNASVLSSNKGSRQT